MSRSIHAAQHATPFLGDGPSGQMDNGVTVIGGLDPIAMPGALQGMKRRVLGGEDMLLWMGFVGTLDLARPRQQHRMIVAGAAFGGQQLVPAVALVEMGPSVSPSSVPCQIVFIGPTRTCAVGSYSCRRMPANMLGRLR
ncbi:MAG: hypothetical protein JWP26_527 [Devosia sp.]|nr:hypothetical protein [Devosia sp.]